MTDVRAYPVRQYFRATAQTVLKCSAQCGRLIDKDEIYVSDGHAHYHGRCAPRVVTVDLTEDKDE